MMKKIFFCKNGGTSFFKKTSLVITISAKTEGNFFLFLLIQKYCFILAMGNNDTSPRLSFLVINKRKNNK